MGGAAEGRPCLALEAQLVQKSVKQALHEIWYLHMEMMRSLCVSTWKLWQTKTLIVRADLRRAIRRVHLILILHIMGTFCYEIIQNYGYEIHYIRNYWYEVGTKFDDCGTKRRRGVYLLTYGLYLITSGLYFVEFPTNFVPQSSNFVPTSSQLRPNFVPTSSQLRPNIWEENDVQGPHDIPYNNSNV